MMQPQTLWLWLRLPQVSHLVIERGYAANEAEAHSQIVPVISRGKLPLRGHTGDVRLNLPARPSISQSVGYGWLVVPILDVPASTILYPCRGSGWETRMRPTVIEIHAEDVDRIWPRRERGKGRPLEFDWDEAEQFTFKILDEKGDPTDRLNNRPKGWRSVENLVGAIIEHLEVELGAGEGPGRTTVQPKATAWLQAWRDAQAAKKIGCTFPAITGHYRQQ